MDQTKKKRKNKIIKSSPVSSDTYNPADYDDNIKYLIGWPGYRTSNNKSGLGYIETQAEWGHMQGSMIRWMITGKFKTRNPFYLFFITLFELFSSTPILLLFLPEGRLALFRFPHIFLPATLIGILLLINVILSLLRCEKGESITGD